jgi:hypothetical protein
MVIVPEMFRRIAARRRHFQQQVRAVGEGEHCRSRVIVPGEAPGDSVPRTSILALTMPAVPKVAHHGRRP